MTELHPSFAFPFCFDPPSLDLPSAAPPPKLSSSPSFRQLPPPDQFLDDFPDSIFHPPSMASTTSSSSSNSAPPQPCQFSPISSSPFDPRSRELVAASQHSEKQPLTLREIELDDILAANAAAESLCFTLAGCDASAGSYRSFLPPTQILSSIAVDSFLEDRVQFCCNETVSSGDAARNAGVHGGGIEGLLEGASTFAAPESCISENGSSPAEDAGVRHSSSDFDNFLDILLEEVEASVQQTSTVDLSLFVDSSSAQVSTTCSSCLDWGDEFSFIDGASPELSMSRQLHDRNPNLISSPSHSLPRKRESWNWTPIACEEYGNNLLRSCSDIHRYLPGKNESFCEPNESAAQHSSAAASSGSNLSSSQKAGFSTWAGPTLLDIESALARVAPAALSMSSPIMTVSNSSASSSLSEGLDDEKGCNSALDDAVRRSEFVSLAIRRSRISGLESLSGEELMRPDAWRSPTKHGSAEAKYTLKVRREEESMNDGYRWRKYGQKTIKNRPYPRSYYRCTTRKCTVKKQVEQSIQDPNILLVTYEGIHLHHRPNPLAMICSPLQIVHTEEI